MAREDLHPTADRPIHGPTRHSLMVECLTPQERADRALIAWIPPKHSAWLEHA
jgi:hypothetical protein